jgi:predicted nuclease of predicted toxin-antitoxin system
LKFLVDVHIANSISRALAEAGHQVVRAAIEHAIWSDEDLLSLAVREGLIIVTQASDFLQPRLRLWHGAAARHHLHPRRAGASAYDG